MPLPFNTCLKRRALSYDGRDEVALAEHMKTCPMCRAWPGFTIAAHDREPGPAVECPCGETFDTVEDFDCHLLRGCSNFEATARARGYWRSLDAPVIPSVVHDQVLIDSMPDAPDPATIALLASMYPEAPGVTEVEAGGPAGLFTAEAPMGESWPPLDSPQPPAREPSDPADFDALMAKLEHHGVTFTVDAHDGTPVATVSLPWSLPDPRTREVMQELVPFGDRIQGFRFPNLPPLSPVTTSFLVQSEAAQRAMRPILNYPIQSLGGDALDAVIRSIVSELVVKKISINDDDLVAYCEADAELVMTQVEKELATPPPWERVPNKRVTEYALVVRYHGRVKLLEYEGHFLDFERSESGVDIVDMIGTPPTDGLWVWEGTAYIGPLVYTMDSMYPESDGIEFEGEFRELTEDEQRSFFDDDVPWDRWYTQPAARRGKDGVYVCICEAGDYGPMCVQCGAAALNEGGTPESETP